MQKKSKNRVRLQAGKWRGRSLSFPAIEGVRPTKSMVKETLMNWVRPVLPRYHCLDLFAGSGSLSFELASQGAQTVVCLDKSPQVCRALEKNKENLAASNIVVAQWEYPKLPEAVIKAYDLILLDPPFGELAGEEMLSWLASSELLAKGAIVYLEQADKQPWPEAKGWEVVRHKRSGGVQFGLLQQLHGE